MTLSDSDRGKLEKAIDHAVSLSTVMTELGQSDIGKDVLRLTNARDFVLGSALTYVMIDFVVNTNRNINDLNQDQLFDIYVIILKRFVKEIAILAPAHSKSKKQSRRRRTRPA